MYTLPFVIWNQFYYKRDRAGLQGIFAPIRKNLPIPPPAKIVPVGNAVPGIPAVKCCDFDGGQANTEWPGRGDYQSPATWIFPACSLHGAMLVFNAHLPDNCEIITFSARAVDRKLLYDCHRRSWTIYALC